MADIVRILVVVLTIPVFAPIILVLYGVSVVIDSAAALKFRGVLWPIHAFVVSEHFKRAFVAVVGGAIMVAGVSAALSMQGVRETATRQAAIDGATK